MPICAARAPAARTAAMPRPVAIPPAATSGSVGRARDQLQQRQQRGRRIVRIVERASDGLPPPRPARRARRRPPPCACLASAGTSRCTRRRCLQPRSRCDDVRRPGSRTRTRRRRGARARRARASRPIRRRSSAARRARRRTALPRPPSARHSARAPPRRRRDAREEEVDAERPLGQLRRTSAMSSATSDAVL